MKKTLSVALLALLLVSCAKPINESQGTGNIIGTVADKTTGEFVPTVNVNLSGFGNQTVTGSDGSFQFNNLGPGSYTLDLQKEGYKLESYTAVVFPDKNTELHLLIERIPSIITADKDVLEFGNNIGVTLLSVSIVNPGYLDLHWSVSWDKTINWIKEVVGQDGKSEGTLGFGKTASLVVKIDRDALANGYNEATVVIWSDNGRSELKITAIGADRRMATTNVLAATNIQTTSATLNAEVTSIGSPEYTERGFVVSTSEFSDDSSISGLRKISAPVNKSNVYSADVSGLSKGVRYYVRAYAKNSIGTKLSSNYVVFTTIGAITQVETEAVSSIDVINGKVQFNGKIVIAGEPVYSEKGFCYNTSGEPVTSDTKITVSGNDAGNFHYSCAGLSTNTTYYVRAYAIQNEKIIYGSTVNFKLDKSTTDVSTSGATNVKPSSATLNGSIVKEGSPAYSEKGFCYSTSSNPTVNSTKKVVSGTGEGDFSINIAGLSYNTTYYYRAYAIQNGTVIYGSVVNFNTGYTETVIETYSSVSNIEYESAKVSFIINAAGDPACTEAGICYSTSSTPTTSSNRVKGNISTYKQSLTVTGLQKSTTYYFRAYAIQNGQAVYGSTFSFKTATKPSVTTLSPSGLQNPIGLLNGWQVQLNGSVNSVGDPKITSRGFKYSTYGDPESSGTTKSVSGSSAGDFSASLTGLNSNTTYYVRAYVKNSLGYVYGELITFTTGNSGVIF